MESVTPHVALLGDSVFDSRAYLPGAPDMAARLVAAAHSSCPDLQASLIAKSGSRLVDLARQAPRIPQDASHVIASIGGNDLLDLGYRLRQGAGLLDRMQRVEPLLEEFRTRYANACVQLDGPHAVALCTIYEPPVSDPMLRMVAGAVSRVVNDVVQEQARRRGFDVIDLRPVCRAPEDFYDPIHPSPTGADKIARVLVDWVRQVERRRSTGAKRAHG